jgi:hypothetical protein
MSSTMKVSLLALISTVAAAPHYSHQKHHQSGKAHGTGTGHYQPYPAYPTGLNSTAPQFPTASGAAVESTSTVLDTLVSTQTIFSTIYATRSGVAGVLEPSSVDAAALCGPETVVVTATEKVTVTVSASASSDVVPVPSEVPASTSSSAVAEPSSSYGKRQDWDTIDYDLSNVNWNEVFASSAPAAAPAPAPVSTPAPAPVVEAPATTSAAVVEAPAPVAEVSSPAEIEEPVASSAAPVASSTPVSGGGSYSGGKRGLAYNDVSLCSSFSGGNFGFAYNWAQTESNDLPDGIQFIPMMHKTSDSTAEAFLANVDAAVAKGTTAVMGFNEPDHTEQANMSPEDACTAWASYLEPITSSHPNVAILSPSVTNGPAPMGLDWLSRFQKNCPGATWHAANIHFYDQYDDQTFDRFKAHVELAISTFNKPLWITEFGLNPGTATPDQAASFLKQAISYLDGNASVQGYAWFMVGTDTSFNMLNSGNGLSTTGEIYASS